MALRNQFWKYIAKTVPEPLAFEVHRAEGIYLFDADGKPYIDFISGIGVAQLGHQHPAVLSAIHQQVDAYLHTMVYGEHIQSPQVLLAEKLLSVLPVFFEQVYFLSAGTEAIETAIKLARKSTGRSGIAACRNAYHGSTYGAMSLMSATDKTSAYGPLLPDVFHIQFNDSSSLEWIDDSVAAVITEVVQAESGIYPAQFSFLQALRKRCDETGALLIFDEIQSGLGRAGHMFAFEAYGITPDVLVLGKSIGGGMPLAACISSKAIMECLAQDPPLSHMTTFGGHPVSCAAGLAAVKFLIETDLISKSKTLSDRLATGLKHPAVKEVRKTAGLWMALDMGDAAKVQKLIAAAMSRGLLIDWFLFNDECIRLAPPLTISEQEVDLAILILRKCLDELIYPQ
jgi:acetylornithine/N-succinyldiaminopimelate aminotransferase